MTILLILLAFVFGVVLAFFVLSKRGKNKEDVISHELAAKEIQLSALKEEAIKKETALKEQYHKLLEEADTKSEQKLLELKARYEALLAEATSKCEQLDELLQNATDGKLDEQIRTRLSEADSLKKKLKDLEEELEEKEDDVTDLRKKLKNKDVTMEELQTSLSQEQKASQQLRSDLSAVHEELDRKSEELSLKLESLDFIHQILEAEDIKTIDAVELEKSIDFFESFVRGRYLDLRSYLFDKHKGEIKGLKDIKMNEKKQILESFEQWASTKRKSWLDGKITIAFVGEFSAGKTSIVNRILSQDDPKIPLLPVSTKATTAIPTYIAGGPQETYRFVSGDYKQKIINEEVFKKVSKKVLEQIKGVSSLIKYFVMTYKNPHLEGVSILDTPGFSSNDEEDQKRTIDVINECDALFWVIDVNTGTINKTSLSLIKEKLRKPLYIVINKVDTKAESDVKDVEDLIRKTMSEDGLSVQGYIRFSRKTPLQEIMNIIKNIPRTELRTSFVCDIENDLSALNNEIYKKCNRLNNKLKETENKRDSITNQVVMYMNRLIENCVTASSIPKWTEHLFSKDRYEMSAEEGQQLMYLLQEISDSHVRYLAEKIDEQMEKVGEVQKRYEELNEAKVAWHKIDECTKHFNKIKQTFN